MIPRAFLQFDDLELSTLIGVYLDHVNFATKELRAKEFQKLLADTHRMLVMSDYKYAMAVLPLAIEPLQKIRFIPYAHQRFTKFLSAGEHRFGEDNGPDLTASTTSSS